MAIKFNGQDLPPHIVVNDVKVSILPPIKRTTIEVEGRNGVYDFGNTFEERKIEVDYTIKALDAVGLRIKARDFAQWLYTEDYAEFILWDEPDKYYMAKLEGDTGIAEILKYGQGSLSFVAEPFLYGQEVSYNFNADTTNATLMDNDGGHITYPKIHLEFSDSTTSLAIATSDEIMIFGTPADVQSTAVDTNPIVLNDEMTTTTGWSTATTVDGGSVYGSFETIGQSFIQARVDQDGVMVSDYGTGAGWHGASAIKALPNPIQDFHVEGRVSIEASDPKEIGRVEIYLLDVNGVEIGKIAMKDVSVSGYHNRAEARVGDFYGDHHYFVNSYGAYAGVWRYFNEGVLSIKRQGNEWDAWFAIADGSGGFHTNWETHFVDVNDIATAQLAQVQIHIGAYGAHVPVSTMQFNHLRVRNLDQPTTTQIPMIFKAGDILDIDCEKGEIIKNGRPFYTEYDPSSSFIKLEKGANGIAVLPNVTTNGTVTFRERWL